jgi:hypothetical protein
MNIFRTSVLLDVLGELAIANPKAYIYSFAAAGAVVAVFLYGFFGWWLGHFFGYGTEGAYLAEAWYAWWAITNVETLKGLLDLQVETLENLIKSQGL